MVIFVKTEMEALINDAKMREKLIKTIEGPKPVIPITNINAVQIPIQQLIHFKDNMNQMEPDKFDSLLESIKQMGILEPLLVNKRKITREIDGSTIFDRTNYDDDTYVVLDGNHRLEAGIALRMDSLPCKILEVSSEKELQYNIHFNEFRGELQINLISRAVQEMIQDGMSIKQISQKLNLSESRILCYADFADMDSSYVDALQKSMLNQYAFLPIALPIDIVNKILSGTYLQGTERLIYRELGQIMGNLLIAYIDNDLSKLSNNRTRVVKNVCKCGHNYLTHFKDDVSGKSVCSKCGCTSYKQQDKVIFSNNVRQLNDVIKQAIEQAKNISSRESELQHAEVKSD